MFEGGGKGRGSPEKTLKKIKEKKKIPFFFFIFSYTLNLLPI